MYQDLTIKQVKIIEFIVEEVNKKGYPPSVREICKAVGLKSTSSVHNHLVTLQKLGYTTIAKLKEIEKPGKLANDLNGYKKKNKLDLPGLSPEVVERWIKS